MTQGRIKVILPSESFSCARCMAMPCWRTPLSSERLFLGLKLYNFDASLGDWRRRPRDVLGEASQWRGRQSASHCRLKMLWTRAFVMQRHVKAATLGLKTSFT